MSIKIEARADELIDQYACDDEGMQKLALRVAELEWEVEDLKEELEDRLQEALSAPWGEY